jgi:simple sugar transport system substrate-binding protein
LEDKLKKQISILLAALSLALVFAGCDKSGDPSPSSSAADETYTIAVVVKIVGIPFFNVFEDGVKRASSELGVNGYVTGPTEADPAQQVKIVEDLINSDVDAIVVVPNDATALEPVLGRARQKGIVVIANESPDQEGANADVEMIDNKKFAEAAAESLAKASGGRGGYVIYVGGLSVPLHNTWADVARDYLASNYPNLKEVTDRIPCGEDAELAYTRTWELLTTYPDLAGILGFGSLGPIGAAQALKERNLAGKVAVVGNVMPEMAAPYLKEGSITEGYLWNPADSGYASVFAAKYLLENKPINGIDIPGIGKPAITGNTLAFDATLVITADNALSLGF